jgi:spore coat protein U-like protein
MRKLISRAALAAGALVLGMAGAYAQGASPNTTPATPTLYDQKTLNVQVTVASSCSITSLPNILFDTITAGNQTTDDPKNSMVSVACNSGSWNLRANATSNVAGDRSMKNVASPSNTLTYRLCTNNTNTYAGCSSPFNATNAIAGTDSTPATIYAVMQPGVNPTATGVFADTVVIQLTN